MPPSVDQLRRRYPPRRRGTSLDEASKGIPLNLAQRRMGHAQLSTTAICAEALGEEEQEIARKMW